MSQAALVDIRTKDRKRSPGPAIGRPGSGTQAGGGNPGNGKPLPRIRLAALAVLLLLSFANVGWLVWERSDEVSAAVQPFDGEARPTEPLAARAAPAKEPGALPPLPTLLTERQTRPVEEKIVKVVPRVEIDIASPPDARGEAAHPGPPASNRPASSGEVLPAATSARLKHYVPASRRQTTGPAAAQDSKLAKAAEPAVTAATAPPSRVSTEVAKRRSGATPSRSSPEGAENQSKSSLGALVGLSPKSHSSESQAPKSRARTERAGRTVPETESKQAAIPWPATVRLPQGPKIPPRSDLQPVQSGPVPASEPVSQRPIVSGQPVLPTRRPQRQAAPASRLKPRDRSSSGRAKPKRILTLGELIAGITRTPYCHSTKRSNSANCSFRDLESATVLCKMRGAANGTVSDTTF